MRARSIGAAVMAMVLVACGGDESGENGGHAGGGASGNGGSAGTGGTPSGGGSSGNGGTTGGGGSGGGAGGSPCAGLVSDKNAHAMTALAKPAVGQSVTDPEFGTTIRRITDAGLSGVVKPMYSTIQAWNADESRMILYRVDSGHQLFDGKSYQFIGDLDISPADLEQIYWHTSDPDILFYIDGATLVRYHVSSGQKESYHTFSCPSASGGDDPMFTSWDSNALGVACSSEGFGFRIDTKTEGSKIAISSGLAPQAAPSGLSYFLEGTVRDPDMNVLLTLDLADPYNHASLGQLSNGHDVYAGVVFDPGPGGSGEGTLVAHDLTDGSSWVVVGPDTGYPYPPGGTHVSALAYHRPGWVVASIVGEHTGQTLLDSELLLADVNPGGEVCRIAHHRSFGNDGPQGYWAEPHPIISPSGTRVLFASDWGGEDSVDTYVVELPGYTP